MRKLFDSQVFVWVVIAAVGAALVYGFFLVGTPGTQRALQLDQRRVADLQQIAFAIDQYWERNEGLPEDLASLQDQRYYFVQSIEDPATNERYEYVPSEGTAYQLCAVFELGSSEASSVFRAPSKAWEHEAGRTCFELEVQPRLTPAR